MFKSLQKNNVYEDKPDRIEMILEEISDIKRLILEMSTNAISCQCKGLTPDDQQEE